LNIQNFTQLTDYIEHQKFRENALQDVESRLLKDANLDERLSRVLESYDHKIKNKSIDLLTIQFAREAFLTLSELTEDELVDICYAEKINIKSMLKLALKIRHTRKEAGEQFSKNNLNNSLFEFIFSNKPLFNLLEENKKTSGHTALKSLYLNPSFLYLVDVHRINPHNIFEKISYLESAERELNLLNLNLLIKNKKILDVVVHALQNKLSIEISNEALFELLFIEHVDIESLCKMTDKQAMNYLKFER